MLSHDIFILISLLLLGVRHIIIIIGEGIDTREAPRKAEHVGALDGGRHDDCHLVKMDPDMILEWFCFLVDLEEILHTSSISGVIEAPVSLLQVQPDLFLMA
jgi:hypothetical protein